MVVMKAEKMAETMVANWDALSAVLTEHRWGH